MSIESKCGACVRGDHQRHDRDHGIIPGLIGGTYCGCSGDCKPLALVDVLPPPVPTSPGRGFALPDGEVDHTPTMLDRPQFVDVPAEDLADAE